MNTTAGTATDVKHFEHGRVTREWQYANSAGSLGALFGIMFDMP